MAHLLNRLPGSILGLLLAMQGLQKFFTVFHPIQYERIKRTIKVSLDSGNPWSKEYWDGSLDEGRGCRYCPGIHFL